MEGSRLVMSITFEGHNVRVVRVGQESIVSGLLAGAKTDAVLGPGAVINERLWPCSIGTSTSTYLQ